MGLANSQQEKYLIAEQVKALYIQAPASNLTLLGISTIFYFFLRDHLNPGLIAIWLGLMFCAGLSRLFLWHLHRTRADSASSESWLIRYTVASGLTGLSWSLVYLFLQDLNNVVVIVALFMLVFGVLSSAVSVLSVYLPAFVVYTYPQVLMLMVAFYSQSEISQDFIVAALLIYIAMLTVFARNTNHQLVSRIMLSYENQNLVAKLNNEVEQREGVIRDRTEELRLSNRELGAEVRERQKAENSANLQYGLLRGVLNSTPDLIFYKDYRSCDGAYIGGNKAFSEFVGKPIGDIVGKNDLELFGEELGDFFRSKDREMLEINEARVNEEWVDYPDGRSVLLSTLKTPFYAEDEKMIGVLGVSRDITEQHKVEERLREQERSLRYLAHHDALTDLPNRLLMTDRLNKSIHKAHRAGAGLAVFFLDLDNFKEINDSLGHTLGDQLLKAVAQRLRESVREEDTVARLGGDEFTILAEDLNDSMAAGQLAEKVLGAFAEPIKLDGNELNVTPSIGISLYPGDGQETETLLRNADAAMYRAKYDGRNGFCFYSSEMTERAQARIAVESDLRVALAEDQFLLYFQPQIDFQTGRLVGVEALIRWQHPTEGFLLPKRFISIAEDTGQISAIGSWVLKRACRFMKQWEDVGMSDIRMAVNISGRQMMDGDLAETVSAALSCSGCRPESLELEITEGFLIRKPEKSRVMLEELRDMGIRVAIDDFGTGYSSLSYLKQFPINKLKIDYSFVRDISIDTNDQAISTAIIALGKALDLTVIAEGVETREQAAFLKARGCDQAQGYYYARPLGEKDLLDFWRASVNQSF